MLCCGPIHSRKLFLGLEGLKTSTLGEGERQNGGDEETLLFSAVDGASRRVHSGENARTNAQLYGSRGKGDRKERRLRGKRKQE
ncbi:hypothetical protein EYF80_044813 [Liparis tanakae]|uniref:Uncharacterized protein n=1 Tax=Liparis tanakae TaxID=230148 RepID=A0A4Z2FUV0_9TELE|nr:hypothetical protein EYF80_044813 [Liparis tanakae]